MLDGSRTDSGGWLGWGCLPLTSTPVPTYGLHVMRRSSTQTMACVMMLAQLAFGAWRGQVVTLAHQECGREGGHHAALHHHDHEDGHRGAHSHDDAPMHLHMPDHDARMTAAGSTISPLHPCVVPCGLADTADIPLCPARKGGCRQRGLSDEGAIPRSPLEALNVIRLLV
jgi:hypothetical protein